MSFVCQNFADNPLQFDSKESAMSACTVEVLSFDQTTKNTQTNHSCSYDNLADVNQFLLQIMSFFLFAIRLGSIQDGGIFVSNANGCLRVEILSKCFYNFSDVLRADSGQFVYAICMKDAEGISSLARIMDMVFAEYKSLFN